MLRSIFIVFFWIMGANQALAIEPEFTLIAHQNTPVSSLTMPQIKSLFFKRNAYWSDGTQVTLVALQTGDPAHERFALKMLNSLEFNLEQAWRRAHFAGQLNPVIRVDSFTALIEKVASTPGAIGYMPAQNRENRVKIIQVKGSAS
jgi:ABC-type phosphate transport system substrate-binding protein